MNPASAQSFTGPAIPANQNHTLLALLAGGLKGYNDQRDEKQKQQTTMMANVLPSLVKAGYDPATMLKPYGVNLGTRDPNKMDYETLKDAAAYQKDLLDIATKQDNRMPQTREEWLAAIQKAKAAKMLGDASGMPVTFGPSGMSVGKTDAFANMLGGGADQTSSPFDQASFDNLMTSMYGPSSSTPTQTSLNNPKPKELIGTFTAANKKKYKRYSDGSTEWL